MLFSKDILYPSLKMMLANFETYLAGIEKEDETTATETETETETDSGQKTEATEAERKKNKKKLTPSELAKCREQQQCILQMCRVYEGATENDSPQKKSEQLHKIINLLVFVLFASNFSFKLNFVLHFFFLGKVWNASEWVNSRSESIQWNGQWRFRLCIE